MDVDLVPVDVKASKHRAPTPRVLVTPCWVLSAVKSFKGGVQRGCAEGIRQAEEQCHLSPPSWEHDATEPDVQMAADMKASRLGLLKLAAHVSLREEDVWLRIKDGAITCSGDDRVRGTTLTMSLATLL
ncbi:unnamed protein product [Gadus morhua 'NCC']